jgi:hypothetical protein
MTQHDPQHMRPPAFAILHHPGSLAKIHLRFRSRLAFHPAKGQVSDALQSQRQPPHRVIAAGKLMRTDQILINALDRKARRKACSTSSFHGSHRLAGPMPAGEPVCGWVGDFGSGAAADPVCGVGDFDVSAARYLRTVTRSSPSSRAILRLDHPC